MYLGNYITRVLYLLTLAAVFTCLLSSSSFIVHGENGSIESEHEISDPQFSGPIFSDSELLCPDSFVLKSVVRDQRTTSKGVIVNQEETEENLTAYIHLFPGTDAKVLTSCSDVKEWDEASSTAAVSVKQESLEAVSYLKGVRSVQLAISPVIRKIDPEEKGFFSSRGFWKPDDVTGAGIKIGIISDGVEDISEAIASGTLPDNVHILSSGKGTEGTVILKVVHEVSPDAELYFYSAGSNKLEFNKAVDALVTEGCKVICDDVGWPDEPFFEDGIVASHIKEVIQSQGILYVSAAGNDAGRHYQRMFFDNGSGWHDFSSGTSNFKNICVDIPQGEKATVVLQWNDSWNSSENDYDLYLFDRCNGEQLAASEKIQNGAGAPLEYVQYINKEETIKKVSISVKKQSGQVKVLEVYIYANSSVEIHPENLVKEDSVFGHPAIPEVICVGAVNSGSPQGEIIASYSSRGPVSIYYPKYELRNKPDLSGPGSVRVPGINGTDSLFKGTSASAPSVAGIGALIWSMYPEKNGSEIREIMCSSAEDLGKPGYDTIFGYGSVNDSTVSVLEKLYKGNSLSSEKSGISSVESKGIFTLKLSVPLEQICYMTKLPSGKR